MKNYNKYTAQYYLPPERCMEWAEKDKIDRAPVWCSVDLRDGNQALVEPMSLDTKTEFFTLLTDMGFKEIEVGFPAASETEYAFLRRLIEENLIPDDVTVQVLTQAREHIIKRTFDAIKGAKNVIVHVYNSTSKAQREQVFRKDKSEIKKIAVEGARLLKTLSEENGGNYRFEYSPESFTGTECEYALEVCNEVLDVWRPTADRKAIINLPATVENSMPHVFARQVEYMSKNLIFRDAVALSIHPHNDRGCAVADSEMGILAGADRVEGTLFGNGERTGNADIVNIAMNMFSQGVDPGLDFSDMPKISAAYSRFTSMSVSPRQPYAGELVFAAFSGSHQDAIAKGMAYRAERGEKIWSVPYLPIDPEDVGRKYDAEVIRINSQSGKGGVGFILERNFSLKLPAEMKEQFSYKAKSVSDRLHSELKPDDVYEIFKKEYYLKEDVFSVEECHFVQCGGIEAKIRINVGGEIFESSALGNGRLDAVSNALKKHFGAEYVLKKYEEHALERGSRSKAAAYVGVEKGEKTYWGAGVDEDIIRASLSALVSALNNLFLAENKN